MAHKLSIFWFRRDLRLHDNHGFFQSLTQSESVLPIFIFDPHILDKLSNDDRRVSLLMDRLNSLNKQLEKIGKKIHIMYGNPKDVIEEISEKISAQALYTNTDYEPYATKRDRAVKQLLSKKNIKFYSFKDQVIFEKNEILTNTEKPYSIYTPYMKKWMSKFKISLTKPYLSQDFLHKCVVNNSLQCITSLDQIGFIYASYILNEPKLDYRTLLDYENTRNNPDCEGTSFLSTHLRFGFVSVREVVNIAYQYSETFLKEIIWRSFFAQVLWNNPRVVHSCYKEKYDAIEWEENTDLFRKWKYGETGFLMVDAGMRELYETGYMHGRVRMLTASFLVKNMGIDWRLGEAYFASVLLDYDLASNNGNWQWVAGTGCDSSPYFRIFNPETQRKNFDPNYTYCKKWISELREDGRYTTPKILDLKASAALSISRYKQCL